MDENIVTFQGQRTALTQLVDARIDDQKIIINDFFVEVKMKLPPHVRSMTIKQLFELETETKTCDYTKRAEFERQKAILKNFIEKFIRTQKNYIDEHFKFIKKTLPIDIFKKPILKMVD